MTALAGSTSLAVVVLSVLAFSALAGTSHALEACSSFSTCSDCACRTFAYNVNDDCTSGCAWLPESGTCVSADRAVNDTSAVTTLFGNPLPGDDDHSSDRYASGSRGRSWRQSMVANDNVNCPLVTASGTIPTIRIMFNVGGAIMLFLAIRHACFMRSSRSTRDTTWVRDMVRSHTPEGETVQWEATSKPRSEMTHTGYLLAYLAVFAFMLLPTTIWTLVGLPYTIDYDWEFGFFFSIFFVGGFGVFLSFMLCGIALDPAKVSGYLITDRRVVIITATVRSKKMRSVVSHNLGSISTIRVRGDVVSFTSTLSGRAAGGAGAYVGAGAAPPNPQESVQRNPFSGGNSSTITFRGLQNTGSVYRFLQRLADTRDGGADVPVGVAVVPASGTNTKRDEDPTPAALSMVPLQIGTPATTSDGYRMV